MDPFLVDILMDSKVGKHNLNTPDMASESRKMSGEAATHSKVTLDLKSIIVV